MNARLRFVAILILMIPSPGLAFAPQSPARAGISDRDKAGLRGPVKICVEESIYPAKGDPPERRFATTTEYTLDGRIRQEHPDSSPDTSHYQHDEQGRKIKIENAPGLCRAALGGSSFCPASRLCRGALEARSFFPFSKVAVWDFHDDLQRAGSRHRRPTPGCTGSARLHV
jgi:hypothetical protein